jgi:hypothetical protein
MPLLSTSEASAPSSIAIRFWMRSALGVLPYRV